MIRGFWGVGSVAGGWCFGLGFMIMGLPLLWAVAGNSMDLGGNEAVAGVK